MFDSWSTGLLLAAGFALMATVIVAFLLKPLLFWNVLARILVTPFAIVFGVWRWVRTLFSIPRLYRDNLARAGHEHTAAAIHHYAQTAMLLGTAGEEFLPAAREIFERVIADCGVRPASAPFDPLEALAPDERAGKRRGGAPGDDPFTAMQRNAAIAAAGSNPKPGAKPKQA